MSFQLNQFKLSNIEGEVMNVNPSTIDVKLSKDMVGTVKAGSTVKLVASEVGDLPVVDKAVSGDSGFGVVLFNAKKATYAANDVTEIAIVGSIISMVAGTALNRAQLVSWNSVSLSLQATSGNYLGYLIDVASATGDIVRVVLQPKLS